MPAPIAQRRLRPSPVYGWWTNRGRGWSSRARPDAASRPATSSSTSTPTAARRVSWLELVAREFDGPHPPVAVTGPYRFYDWDIVGRVLVRMYDYSLAPLTHVLAQYVFGLGAVLYGGNFAVRRDALEAIGGFDTSIEFHGEDTNLARRISKAGRVRLRQPCWVFTSARRYKTMGRGKVFGLYVRNFCAEIFFHRPSDTTHEDVRA